MAEYDDYATEFSKQRAGASLNRLIEEPVVHRLIGDPNGLRVLDAGCGDGSYCRWLARKGAKATGLDASAELIHIARDHDDAIEYAVHDLNESLSYDDGSFDLVLCTLVTEYVKDLDQLLEEFARVLVAGGRLVLSCDHPLLAGIEKNERGERVLVDYFARSARAYRWFGRDITVFSHTLEDYARALLAAGFRIDELCEPTPIAAARDDNPDLAERASKIPTIMVVSCSKGKETVFEA